MTAGQAELVAQVFQPTKQLTPHHHHPNPIHMQSREQWRNFTWLNAVQYVIAWSEKVGHQPCTEQWSFAALLCRVGCWLHSECIPSVKSHQWKQSEYKKRTDVYHLKRIRVETSSDTNKFTAHGEHETKKQTTNGCYNMTCKCMQCNQSMVPEEVCWAYKCIADTHFITVSL